VNLLGTVLVVIAFAFLAHLVKLIPAAIEVISR
jgi:hypothetical protein